MAQFNTINCVIFLLYQLMFALITQASPETLTFRIQDGQEITTLNLKRTDRSVANTNLPIWRAWRLREPELVTGLMEGIGPFAMYHDIEKSSAVVLFQYPQRIYGIIDTRYIVSALPRDEAEPNTIHVVHNEGYVKRRSEQNHFHDEIDDFPAATDIDMAYINSFVDNWINSAPQGSPRSTPSLDPYSIFSSRSGQSGSYGRSHSGSVSSSSSSAITNPRPGPSNEHRRTNNNLVQTLHRSEDTLYAEVLVLVSHNIVRQITKKDPDLKVLVAYYLVYFNAIDMLYAKLANYADIRINIAGIVIESQIMVFPYNFKESDERPLRIIDGTETLRRLPIYLKKYENVFPQDSFDFFFLSTRFMIEDKNDDGDDSSSSRGISDASDPMTEWVPCDGISRLVNVYANRKNRRVRFDAPGSIVERKSMYGDYITAAHEIAHLMYVDHDSTSQGYPCDGGQCFAILQETGTYCRNCIRWSEKSIREFTSYASTHLDRCFLLNQPRSLHPYGTILTTLGPNQQCACYGYASHYTVTGLLDQVNSDRCNDKLACANNNRQVHAAIPNPIDGTPCSLSEVCWRGQCQQLLMPPFVEYYYL